MLEGSNGVGDIAIVGLGCRFPGEIIDLKSFAAVLFNGVDAITEIPVDRWSIDKFYSSEHTSGKSRTKWGGFIKNPYHFDAKYFNLTPREVNSMDPQQRLLLEVFLESIQDANLTEEKIKNSNTGIYIGAFTLDHMINEASQSNWNAINAHTSTGSMMTLLANRISYLYDLTGPSLVIDTACSSSLVAVHLAVEAIKNGDCTQAVAGGVNLMLNPSVYVAESKANMLSPTGRSRSFDEKADGYVRGEGVGLVVLKRLDDAIKEKDHIYAIIKASTVNQDGRSAGQTVPNGLAQEKLIRTACQRAGVAPSDLQYVEAHGTGTPVGDPIEANAIGLAVSEGRDKNNFCYIGSVKTNFGHTEAAAGIAALIKVLVCLKYEKIPKLVHFNKYNPQIDFENLKIRPVTENLNWAKTKSARLAGVNCFGFGGTNAHVILSDPPEYALIDHQNSQSENSNRIHYLPVSAKDEKALNQAVSNMLDMLATGDYSVDHICSSAALFRSHYNKRAIFSGKTLNDITAKMRLFLEQQSLIDTTNKDYLTTNNVTKATMVLSGMGPQWWGMGRELLDSEPIFRKTFDQCCELFQLLTNDFLLLNEFTSKEYESRMSESQISQAANFALQVSLADLYRSKGIIFDCIIGHSVGEISAAYISGALSLEDAVLVTYHRSRLQQTMSGTGTMLAVGISYQAVDNFLEKCRDKVSVAAVNGPESITLSGDVQELKRLAEIFEEKKLFNKFLKVDVPFHSPILDGLKKEFLTSVSNIKPRKTHTQLISTVTGKSVTGEALNAQYWWLNLREPVYFLNAIESVLQQGTDLFCEIGPHPVLSNSINQILESKKQIVPVIYSLKRGVDQFDIFNESFRQLFLNGYNINWSQIYASGDKSLSLPKYPWQRSEYKNETLASQKWRLENITHELLGFRLFSPVPTWELNINNCELEYVFDHKVLEQGVFPAAAYVEMAFQASQELFSTNKIAIRNMRIKRPIFLPTSEDSVSVRLIFDKDNNTFNIYSQPKLNNEWEHNVRGEIGSRIQYPHFDLVSYDFKDEINYTVSKIEFYKRFEKLGFQYGQAFRLVDSCSVYTNINAVNATLTIPESSSQLSYVLHPTILDSALQCLLFASKIREKQYLPTKIEGLHVYDVPQEKVSVYAKILNQNENILNGEIFIYDKNNRLVVWIEKISAESLDKGYIPAINKNWFCEMAWFQTDKEFNKDSTIQQIMIFADVGTKAISKDLLNKFNADGYEIVLVYADNKTVISKNSARVIPGNEESMQKLFTNFQKPSMVIWLWSMDTIQYETGFAEHLEACHMLGIHSLIACLKSIDQFSPNTRLWLVTKGMVNVTQSKLNISQAHQLGFSRVMSYQEAVGRWCGYLDLDPEGSENESNIIYKEVTSIKNGSIDEVAYRNDVRYIGKLKPYPISQNKLQVKYPKNKSYLITGGLGDLGYLVAKYLIDRGAQHIILQIKHALPDRKTWLVKNSIPDIEQKIQKIKTLEATGAMIHVTTTDITDSESVRLMSMTHIENGFPPIKAVIHCAGSVQDRLVYNMNHDDVNTIFSAKVNASWALHEAFQGQLEMFVLFSSYASVYGAMGQSNYAAANSFMDSLSIYRHQKGMSCISINFGPWSDVGMAAKLDLDGYFSRIGIQCINPDNGWKIFDMLFNENVSQVIVCPTDWSLIDKLYPSGHPTIFTDLLSEKIDNLMQDHKNDESVNIVQQLLSASDDNRNSLLQTFLKETLSTTTGIALHEISLEKRIGDFGIDSIISIDFKNRIEKALPLKVKLVDLLKGPTLMELSNSLEKEFVD